MIRLFGERLSEKDKEVFRKLFPNNRAKTLNDTENAGNLVSVDVAKNCWILLDPCCHSNCPRFVIFFRYGHFLKQPYSKTISV